MPSEPRSTPRNYGNQRKPKNPPHVTLKALRLVAGITAEELCRRIAEENPSLNPTRGTISAIESGLRGASPAMLDAISAAYGLPPGEITTDYAPVTRRNLPEAS